MKTVFVTGATGLLGTNVIIKLIKDGYFVIALVRQKSRYNGPENENLKLVEGSLFSDLSSYLEKVDFVIHIAAETSQNLLSYKEYKNINSDAVVHLFSQSVEANVKKFLFVSTANTLGYGDSGDPGNENRDQKYPFTRSFYAQSKREAEDYLLRNNKTTEAIILNPGFMIGAYDHKPSSGKVIFWTWKKKLVFYPSGGKNFVHAEDVASGIVNAIEKGIKGEKYLLVNENLSYKEFFRKVNVITGQNPVMIRIPNSILNILGILGDILRGLNIKTNLSSSNMKALQIHNYYSNRKSVEELKIRYQSIDIAVSTAIEYFKSTNIDAKYKPPNK